MVDLPAQRPSDTGRGPLYVTAKRTSLATKLQNCCLVQSSANRREDLKSEDLGLNSDPALSQLCKLREGNEPLCSPHLFNLSMNKNTNLKIWLRGLKEITDYKCFVYTNVGDDYCYHDSA